MKYYTITVNGNTMKHLLKKIQEYPLGPGTGAARAHPHQKPGMCSPARSRQRALVLKQ